MPRAWLGCALLILLVSAALHREDDGLWFQGDAPRHLMNGVFVADFAASGEWTEPRAFAERYYRRFPAIAPTLWPPLFYTLEAVVFSVVEPSPRVAKLLVLGFAVLFAIYLHALLRTFGLGGTPLFAGLLALGQPALLVWSNTIMLDVPALAFGTACIYYLERGRREPGRRSLWLALACGVAAFYTRPTGVLLPLAYVAALCLTRGGGRLLRLDSLALGALGALLALPWMMVQARFGTAVLRETFWFGGPLLDAGALLFYPRTLATNLHLWYVALAGGGAAFALASRERRPAAGRTALALLLVVAAFTGIALKEPRYVNGILPLCAVLVALGTDAAQARFGEARPVALRASLVAIALLSALLTRAPSVHGIAEAARSIVDQYPSARILYLGHYDGTFVFYARQASGLTPGGTSVVRGSKVFFAPALQVSFGVEEYVRSAADVRDIVSERATRLIAIEREPSTDLDSERIVRDTLRGDPSFRLVGSYPLESRGARRLSSLDLYEYRGALRTPPVEEFSFPALERHPFD